MLRKLVIMAIIKHNTIQIKFLFSTKRGILIISQNMPNTNNEKAKIHAMSSIKAMLSGTTISSGKIIEKAMDPLLLKILYFPSSTLTSIC